MIKLLLEEKLEEKEQIIVFSRTCKSVQVLGMLLQKIGARASVLHSILKQKQRFAALEQFKSRRSRFEKFQKNILKIFLEYWLQLM